MLQGNQQKGFADHFSEQARAYAQYRPQYPAELYAYLAEIAPGRELAWDAGTGSGQAAHALARHFAQVAATDASAEQIAQAAPHPRITFRVERAEDAALPGGSVDLITAARAVHWFDLEGFYANVRRAARPGGVLAVWMYHLAVVDPAVDAVLYRYYAGVLKGYWPAGFELLDAHYTTLPFPFEKITPPAFTMQAEWTLDQMAGFLSSWSATQRYLKQHGQHPLEQVWGELRAAWGEAARTVRWPLWMRVGRVSPV